MQTTPHSVARPWVLCSVCGQSVAVVTAGVVRSAPVASG